VPELSGQPLRLVGIDPFAEPPFRDYFAPAARGPTSGSLDANALTTFLTEPNSVILSADAAAGAGVALGDTLTVDVPGGRSPARVVGLLRPADDVTRRALGGILFTDIASAQEMLGLRGRSATST
jgi:putative ABC transport system permease protein